MRNIPFSPPDITDLEINEVVEASVSGEEFLKLREAIHSGSKSGRILDQKV